MFKQKTLFIIGAGASAEIDIPVGTGLVHKAYQNLLESETRRVSPLHKVTFNPKTYFLGLSTPKRAQTNLISTIP